jgi:hypothetical protein
LAETPAMWLEVYRWYNMRLLGGRNLLLERREEPRFRRLKSLGRTTISLAAGVRFSASPTPLFWTMYCPLSAKGRIQKLVFRVPKVNVVETTCPGEHISQRVVMDVLISPVMRNSQARSLAEFAALFEDTEPNCQANAIRFEGAIRSYSQTCEVEFLLPEAH